MRKLLFFKFPKSIQIYNLITIQSDSNLCYHERPWISPNVEGLAHLLVRERKGAARVVAIVRQRIQEKKKNKKTPELKPAKSYHPGCSRFTTPFIGSTQRWKQNRSHRVSTSISPLFPRDNEIPFFSSSTSFSCSSSSSPRRPTR